MCDDNRDVRFLSFSEFYVHYRVRQSSFLNCFKPVDNKALMPATVSEIIVLIDRLSSQINLNASPHAFA